MINLNSLLNKAMNFRSLKIKTKINNNNNHNNNKNFL